MRFNGFISVFSFVAAVAVSVGSMAQVADPNANITVTRTTTVEQTVVPYSDMPQQVVLERPVVTERIVIPEATQMRMAQPVQGNYAAQNTASEKPQTVIPQTPYSVLVCRAKQCAKAEYSMTREFLYNKIVGLFENNLNKELLLCDADPTSRVCYNAGIKMAAQTSMVPVSVTVPSARVLDAKLLKGKTGVDLILDYNVDINDTRAVCQSSITRLAVEFIDKVQMSSPGFDCRFTTTGNTQLNATYNIDYVDFDYGTIGAYYTFGIGESVRGGTTGYVLMRFTQKQPSTVGIVDLNVPK